MSERAQTTSPQQPQDGTRQALFTFERFSAWFALGANVVTIAGLVVVVAELGQNQKLTRAQVRHELSAGIVTLLIDTAGNQQLSDVMYRGSQGAALTPTEHLQFEMRANALLRYWEDVHYQYRMGLYDREEFDRQLEAWAAALRESRGFRDYWCRTRARYSPNFANEMNRLLPPGACTRPRS